jgi:ribosomal protein S18 acetylase RimI-like enzyme
MDPVSMHIETLQNIPLEEITACHNLAFSDYVIPLQITTEHLANSIVERSIQLALSPGAFDGEKLVGFMLIGINEFDGRKAFYNGGTGVIPDYRGRHLVNEMYDFLLPKMNEQKIDLGILEVITENKKAFRIYEALSYKTSRKLLCFKGTLKSTSQNPRVTIKPLSRIDFEILTSFWDWQPSWQNQISAVKNLLPQLHVLGAFSDEKLLGYLVYNSLQKRVHQFAVNKALRRQGIGSAMVSYIAQKFGDEIAVINVDESAVATISFLESIGLRLFAEQFEMKLRIASAN